MHFDPDAQELKKLKNNIKIALKPAGIKLQKNLIKVTMGHISVKKNDVALQLSKLFFNHDFLNTKKLIW